MEPEEGELLRVRRDYRFALYLSVEVENSSARVVKETRWACLVREDVKKSSLRLSEGRLSNRRGSCERLESVRKMERTNAGMQRTMRPCTRLDKRLSVLCAPVMIPCCVDLWLSDPPPPTVASLSRCRPPTLPVDKAVVLFISCVKV